MASLPVYDSSGKEVGKYEIDPSEIAPSINKQLLHDVVVMYQASRRQGSHQTKSRSAVAGSRRKMYRQKGTGNARAGSRRTNVRRGGGHGFALQNRDYSYRLPRKVVRAATRMAIAGKIQDQQVKVLDGISLDVPRTAAVAQLLGGVGLSGRRTLIVTSDYAPVVYKSARNIPGATVMPVGELNALVVLESHCLLVTREAVDRLKGVAKEETAVA